MAPDVLAKVIVGNKVDLDSKRAVPKERAQRVRINISSAH